MKIPLKHTTDVPELYSKYKRGDFVRYKDKAHRVLEINYRESRYYIMEITPRNVFKGTWANEEQLDANL